MWPIALMVIGFSGAIFSLGVLFSSKGRKPVTRVWIFILLLSLGLMSISKMMKDDRSHIRKFKEGPTKKEVVYA
ncbi:MAG: hypothetical protein ABEI53_00445 [Candidatus Magasanikbacteria bacterium]